MKKIVFTYLFVYIMGGFALAQDQTKESLGKKIDELTYDWDLKADELDNYEGLTRFCLNAPYRTEILTLLKDLHHYDSVLYERLSKAARFSHDREIKKTIKDIEEFEAEYDMKSLVHFLHEECDRRKDIEHNADVLKGGIGSDSYDGQIYLIETELNKFIKHITKRVDNIRKHVHHLHIE